VKRHIERITDGYLCVLLLLFPLYTGSRGYLDITQAKYVFFVWSSLAYFAIVLCAMILCALQDRRRVLQAGLRQTSLTEAFLLSYVLLCCVSAIVSDYGSMVWLGAGRKEGLGTILLYAGIFFFTARFGKLKKGHLYLIGIVILVNLIIGILQYIGFNPFTLYPKGYTYHDAFTLYANAFLGTLGNIDLLSAYLSLAVPLLYAAFALKEKTGLLLIPFAAGVFLLMLTGVSAGLLGISAGLFLAIPLTANTKRGFVRSLIAGGIAALCAAARYCLSTDYSNRTTVVHMEFGELSLILSLTAAGLLCLSYLVNRFGGRISWNVGKVKKALTICVAAGILAMIAILWAYPFTGGMLASAHRMLHGALDEKAGSSRVQIWQHTMGLVPEHLWFGGGPDTLVQRACLTFERYNEATGTVVRTYLDNAHNDYLNILVNTGVFSLIAYLTALLSVVVRTLRISAADQTSTVLLIGLLCYLIQIFFSFSILIVAPFFWVLFGLLTASLREAKRSENQTAGQPA
jgi:heme exporter protein D